jgi:glycosyltransferase involved in cell wall biosynthesis
MNAPLANQGAAVPGGNPPFIVFSDDWGEHPSSCQHLFRRIARDHPVLWVNTVGMRAPRLSWTDFRKARLKIAKMLAGTRGGESARAESLKLRVYQPKMLPFALSAVRKWNRHSVVAAVNRAAAEFGIRDPVVVCAVPNACDFVDALNARRVVYYCVDDFTQWPGLDHRLIREMDRLMIEAADVLVATSSKLATRLDATGKPTYLLQHGVDLDLFGRDASVEHACLHGIPKPRAGYFGLFDERNDMELIAALARRMPDFSFVFTGPVTADIQGLRALPNIRFTGAVPYNELPDVIAGLDVLFIPYLVNDFTDSISPLKLKEYMATGKAVVTTPMAEAMPYRQQVQVAAGAEEWERALRTGLDADVIARRRSIQGLLAGDSWDEKAQLFLRWCVESAGRPT